MPLPVTRIVLAAKQTRHDRDSVRTRETAERGSVELVFLVFWTMGKEKAKAKADLRIRGKCKL